MEGEILATVCPWMMPMFGEIFYPEQLAGVCVFALHPLCLHKNPLGPDAAA